MIENYTTLDPNFLFIGCGKMGLAILQKFIENNFINSDSINVITKNSKISILPKNQSFNQISQLPSDYKADIIFLCLKPQDIEDVLQEFVKSNKFNQNSIFISIIAGKTISYFTKILGKDAKLLRTMPNLAIKNSCGILPYLANKNITTKELNYIVSLFNDFSLTFDIKEESLFGVITAMFGCGPAYIFLLQEIICDIAIKNGLDPLLATNLVKKLFLGSALMTQNDDVDFKKSRLDVTSKNGVTQSLTDILQKDNSFKNLFNEAINNAIARSKELS